MVIHYEPSPNLDHDPYPACGVACGDTSYTTDNWRGVTCKRCLKQRPRIEEQLKDINEHVIAQMASENEFFEQYNKENDEKKDR